MVSRSMSFSVEVHKTSGPTFTRKANGAQTADVVASDMLTKFTVRPLLLNALACVLEPKLRDAVT